MRIRKMRVCPSRETGVKLRYEFRVTGANPIDLTVINISDSAIVDQFEIG